MEWLGHSILLGVPYEGDPLTPRRVCHLQVITSATPCKQATFDEETWPATMRFESLPPSIKLAQKYLRNALDNVCITFAVTVVHTEGILLIAYTRWHGKQIAVHTSLLVSEAGTTFCNRQLQLRCTVPQCVHCSSCASYSADILSRHVIFGSTCHIPPGSVVQVHQRIPNAVVKLVNHRMPPFMPHSALV